MARRLILAGLSCVWICVIPNSMAAAALPEVTKPVNTPLSTVNPLHVGGWLSAGSTYNSQGSRNRSNAPVVMTDRNSELTLYQSHLFIEKSTNTGDQWAIGGRFDMLYGSDAKQTQAIGNWDAAIINPQEPYALALPQAYLELFAPIGSGISGKFGHFMSVVGYESLPSPLNFFASHSYSFNSAPSTTTGAVFSYALNDHWSVTSGWITGPDSGFNRLSTAGSMHRIDWINPQSGSAASFSLIEGDLPDQSNSHLQYYAATVEQSIGQWHTVLEHDRGMHQSQTSATWYSLVHYLRYTVNDQWSVGIRNEWFNDADNFNYDNGAGHYYASTLGVNINALSWLRLRPEIRYDWSDTASKPFDNASRADQLLMGCDAVIPF